MGTSGQQFMPFSYNIFTSVFIVSKIIYINKDYQYQLEPLCFCICQIDIFWSDLPIFASLSSIIKSTNILSN